MTELWLNELRFSWFESLKTLPKVFYFLSELYDFWTSSKMRKHSRITQTQVCWRWSIQCALNPPSTWRSIHITWLSIAIALDLQNMELDRSCARSRKYSAGVPYNCLEQNLTEQLSSDFYQNHHYPFDDFLSMHEPILSISNS